MKKRVFLTVGAFCAAAIQLGSAPTGPAGGSRPSRPPTTPGPIGPRPPQTPGTGGQGPWGGFGGTKFGPQVPYWPFVPWGPNAPCALTGQCPPDRVPPAPTIVLSQPNYPGPAAFPVDTIQNPASADSLQPDVLVPDDCKTPPNENSGVQFYQSPTLPPVVLDEYPPLVVLKSGGVYAVKRYWIKAKTLYFLTPNGQTFQTPLNSLEQIYPGTKPDRRTE